MKKILRNMKFTAGIGIANALISLFSPSQIAEANFPVQAINQNYYLPYTYSKNYVPTHKRELLSWPFYNAIITTESKWNPNAKSPKGARGLMQFMPNTWNQFGEGDFENAFNPIKNIRAGQKYIEWIENYLSKNHSFWHKTPDFRKRELISAAYHGGPARLKSREFEISKMPYSTRNYVEKVKTNLEKLL